MYVQIDNNKQRNIGVNKVSLAGTWDTSRLYKIKLTTVVR